MRRLTLSSGLTCWLVLASAIISSHALQSPPPPVPTPPITTTTTTTTASPSAFNVNVNVPALIDLVKTPEARTSTLEKVSFLGQSAQYLVPPEAVSVQAPTDVKGFVQQALKGQAAVTVDALGKQQKVDVQILASDWGALTVQIRNPLVPKLPLPGLPDTPPFVANMVAPAVVEASPAALKLAQEAVNLATQPTSSSQDAPFWDRPIQDGTVSIDLPNGYHRALTPLDILGGSSLALGAAYAGSYTYYVAENEREAREAEERKQAMAAKRKAAAAQKKTDSKAGNKTNKAKDAKPLKESKKEETANRVETTNVKVTADTEKVEKKEPTKIVSNTKKEETPAKSSSSITPVKATSSSPTTLGEKQQAEKSTVATVAPLVKEEEEVKLPVASAPQLQRTIPKDKSIALAEEDVDKDAQDEDNVVVPKPRKRRRGIFRIFVGIFGN